MGRDRVRVQASFWGDGNVPDRGRGAQHAEQTARCAQDRADAVTSPPEKPQPSVRSAAREEEQGREGGQGSGLCA